jgi:hypothetical protein
MVRWQPIMVLCKPIMVAWQPIMVKKTGQSGKKKQKTYWKMSCNGKSPETLHLRGAAFAGGDFFNVAGWECACHSLCFWLWRIFLTE